MTQALEINDKTAGVHTQGNAHAALINDFMSKPDATASKTDLADLSPLQSKLADLSRKNAAGSESRGYASRAVHDVLHAVDIDIPRGDSKDIKDVPRLTQLPEGTRPQPGDLIIIGAQHHVSVHGDSFFMTKDGQAAGDRVKPMPDLAKLQNVHIYRAN